jgi:chaperonin GroEL (HSP60 family)
MEPKNKYQFIQIGIDVSNTVRATLGPKGMNKMVINSTNNQPILTNDGATIIKNLKISHPIGSMFKNLAESQEKAIGDGTTTATILTGQLLDGALNLLNKKIHPITIITGYNLARNEALSFLNKYSYQPNVEQIMKTTFGSKISPQLADHLTTIIRDIPMERLRIAKIENSDPMDSRTILGYVLDAFTINDRMPTEAEGNIAILEMKNNLEFAKFQITNTDELNKLESRMKDHKKKVVDALVNQGVKILFYTDTNPEFESYLTEAGIMSIVVYKRDQIDHISKATGAIAIADSNSELTKYLGAGKVRYDKKNGGIFIENPNSEITTLLLCGATKQVLDETERSVDDVIGIMQHLESVVYGAGAFEIELARHLREFSIHIGGKEQLAIEKYAEAIESIPLILAENCGFDAIDALTNLKTAHRQGYTTFGIDPIRTISDAKERGIVEPTELKSHAINSSTDVANLILKLDDIYEGGENK